MCTLSPRIADLGLELVIPKGNYMQILLNWTLRFAGQMCVRPIPSCHVRLSVRTWGGGDHRNAIPPWSCIASPPAIIYLVHVPLESLESRIPCPYPPRFRVNGREHGVDHLPIYLPTRVPTIVMPRTARAD